MTKLTETVVVWAPQYCMFTPQEISALAPGLAANLSYTNSDKSICNHFAENGYTRVGTAEISLQIISHDEMVANKVEALRAEKKKVQAEAAMRANEIDGKIQNLLAITYQPGEA